MVALPCGLQLGDVVAGKYRVLRVVGAGAMGIVVAAHHLNLDRTVAIKFLTAEALAHPDALARFQREARAAARIRSRHVVAVNDVAVLPDGVPYMELEFLDGSDLAARLRDAGPFSPATAVDFVLQACDALAEAHALGIVHRDLKPANLFAVPSAADFDLIKVLDFGISKAGVSVSATLPLGEAPAEISTAGVPIGSPCYMSPEQMRSARDVDARTDIWSLGVTLFELLSGELPFRGQSLVELYSEIKSREPLGLRSRCPDLPEGLDAIVGRCLEFERDHRYPGARELARALVPFAPNRRASYALRVAEKAVQVTPVEGERPPTPRPAVTRPQALAPPDALTKTRVSGPPQAVVVSGPNVARLPARGRWVPVLLAFGVAVGATCLSWLGRAPSTGAALHGAASVDPADARRSPPEPGPRDTPPATPSAPVAAPSATSARAIAPASNASLAPARRPAARPSLAPAPAAPSATSTASLPEPASPRAEATGSAASASSSSAASAATALARALHDRE